MLHSYSIIYKKIIIYFITLFDNCDSDTEESILWSDSTFQLIILENNGIFAFYIPEKFINSILTLVFFFFQKGVNKLISLSFQMI